MTTFQRYMLFQVPGWILTVLLLTALYSWWDLPLWAAVGLALLWLIKDLALYPFLRIGYETAATCGIERLVGAEAVVKQPLDPEGYVRVHGELWRARLTAAQGPLPVGSRVRVEAAEGMTLIVSPRDRRPQTVADDQLSQSSPCF